MLHAGPSSFIILDSRLPDTERCHNTVHQRVLDKHLATHKHYRGAQLIKICSSCRHRMAMEVWSKALTQCAVTPQTFETLLLCTAHPRSHQAPAAHLISIIAPVYQHQSRRAAPCTLLSWPCFEVEYSLCCPVCENSSHTRASWPQYSHAGIYTLYREMPLKLQCNTISPDHLRSQLL